MIDTFQVATQGVGPGFSTFTMASQGFGFEIEVIIRPIDTGGGYYLPDQKYEIIVRIKYKGKTWEQRRTISSLMAKSLEKVLSSFKGIYKSTTRVSAKYMNYIVNKLNVIVKMKK